MGEGWERLWMFLATPYYLLTVSKVVGLIVAHSTTSFVGLHFHKDWVIMVSTEFEAAKKSNSCKMAILQDNFVSTQRDGKFAKSEDDAQPRYMRDFFFQVATWNILPLKAEKMGTEYTFKRCSGFKQLLHGISQPILYAIGLTLVWLAYREDPDAFGGFLGLHWMDMMVYVCLTLSSLGSITSITAQMVIQMEGVCSAQFVRPREKIVLFIIHVASIPLIWIPICSTILRQCNQLAILYLSLGLMCMVIGLFCSSAIIWFLFFPALDGWGAAFGQQCEHLSERDLSVKKWRKVMDVYKTISVLLGQMSPTYFGFCLVISILFIYTAISNFVVNDQNTMEKAYGGLSCYTVSAVGMLFLGFLITFKVYFLVRLASQVQDAYKSLLVPLNKIDRLNRDIDADLRYELSKIRDEIAAAGPITANGYFTLEKSTMISMLSTVATYLVILIQFKMTSGTSEGIEKQR